MGLCTIRVAAGPELLQVKGGGSSGLMTIRLQLHLVTRVKGCSAPRPEENGLTIRSDMFKNDGNRSQSDRRRASYK